jgi:tRNA A-37 threonylcarbamoyl transferase component Bud32
MSIALTKHEQLKQFLQGERNIATPFELAFDSIQVSSVFTCSEVLRLLPGKRLVLKANKGDQQLAIKLFASAQKGQREHNQELKGHALAKAAGVNVPDLIASYTEASDYFAIAYDFLTDTELFSSETVRKKPQVVANIVEIIAKMHNHGIWQQDIHLDNVLLQNDKIYLIDLGSVACETEGKALKKTKSLANLALFVAQFYPMEQDKLIPFLQNYYQARSWLWNEGEKAHFLKILKPIWLKRKQDYLKKCFRNCTMTEYGHDFSKEYAFRRNYFQTDIRDFINNIEHLMGEGEALKAGNSATVVKVIFDGKPIVIKRYNIKSSWHFIRRCMRKSRAAVSWRNANLLGFINLPTLKPIGFIEKRKGWLRHTAYFISEYQDAAELLDVYQQRQASEEELEQIKAIFDLMQKTQISHGDLKAQNLLLNTHGKVSLIDLDSMQEHQNSEQFQKAFNKDKKRFLRNWQDMKVKEKFTSLVY